MEEISLLRLCRGRSEPQRVLVVADGAPAEAFFLENEAFVEPLSVLFGGDAEVEILHSGTMRGQPSDELGKQPVEHTVPASGFRSGDILYMGHALAEEHPATGEERFTPFCLRAQGREEADLLRKAVGEQLHFG